MGVEISVCESVAISGDLRFKAMEAPRNALALPKIGGRDPRDRSLLTTWLGPCTLRDITGTSWRKTDACASLCGMFQCFGYRPSQHNSSRYVDIRTVGMLAVC